MIAGPVNGQDRLGVKLDAFHGLGGVPQSHRDALARAGCHGEHGGQ